jgi:adenylosuccinate lyase
VLEGLRVNEEAIAANVRQSVPTIVLERALMLLTERGESRQQAHARIREIALKAGPNAEAAELANALPEVSYFTNVKSIQKGIRNLGNSI